MFYISCTLNTPYVGGDLIPLNYPKRRILWVVMSRKSLEVRRCFRGTCGSMGKRSGALIAVRFLLLPCLVYFSNLKIESIHSCEMSANFPSFIWDYNSEDCVLHNHRLKIPQIQTFKYAYAFGYLRHIHIIVRHEDYPCGGGVEYLHRDPASRRRRRNGKSQIWDSKIRSRVPRGSDPRLTALAKAYNNCKRQTRPLVRESAPHQQTRNCPTVIKIWS
jgi:hypothetical protein